MKVQNITDIDKFFKVVDSCKGKVELVTGEGDMFDYTWSGPDYPSFTGNYAITNADDTLSLIIWPKSLFREESRFGLQMYDDVWKEGYMFYVDRDMKYSDAENPGFSEREKEKILDWMERRDAEIRQLKELAEAEWKI